VRIIPEARIAPVARPASIGDRDEETSETPGELPRHFSEMHHPSRTDGTLDQRRLA
jgi:hypothetical protein